MSASGSDLRARLEGGPPLLLDGATGTELERRGHWTGLPLWSTHALLDAPDAVRSIHADYAAAGADVITANTFRTQRRALSHPDAPAGLGARDAELTRLAVDLAREGAASADSDAWIAGSAPTLEDCYRPDLVPDDDALAREHARHADALAQAGADLALVETMNTVREALAACRAAQAAGLPAIVSFVCWEGPTLLSGEPLEDALEAIAALAPLAVGVNCLPPSNVPACLPVLARAGLPFAVYANLGEPEDERGFRRSEDTPAAAFGDLARGWVRGGTGLVGGCCGTTPDHIRAIAHAL